MSDAVLVGLISVCGSVVVQMIVSASKARESDAKMAAHEQEQKDRLDHIDGRMAVLEKKIDIHNGYAEKFGSIDKNIAVIQKDIEYLKEKEDK